MDAFCYCWRLLFLIVVDLAEVVQECLLEGVEWPWRQVLLVFQRSLSIPWLPLLTKLSYADGLPSVSTTQATASVACDICNKRFIGINRKYLLKRHKITHSGEKPFHCPYCNHKANIKQNLDVHIKRRHFGNASPANHCVAVPTQYSIASLTEEIDVNNSDNHSWDKGMHFFSWLSPSW